MKPRVQVYVEGLPSNYDYVLTFEKDVDASDTDEGLVYVWLDKERTLLAIALLAQAVGAKVIYEGEEIEVGL